MADHGTRIGKLPFEAEISGVFADTVEPLYSGHHRDQEKVSAIKGVRYKGCPL